MTVELQIPDEVVRAIRLPEEEMKHELLVELSMGLYARGLLSFGKARELAGMAEYDFGRALGRRKIVRHYGPDELEDDLMYAGSE